MTGEPTEMAGVAEADTQCAYAWGALDYDDPDEFPTQRLTPRRVTSLGIVASLVAIATAGTIAIVSMHGSVHAPAVVSAPATVTVMMPPPVTTTVTPAPLPPPPPPAPPSVAAAPSTTASPRDRYPYADEAGFLSAVNAHMPIAYTPEGRSGDGEILAAGYRACAVLDRYSGSQATAVFYRQEGFDDDVLNTQWPGAFMSYATMLCNPEG